MIQVKGIVERGSGRGKKDFVPTINLLLEDVPSSLEYGIYCCSILVGGEKYFGAAHYGHRSTLDNLVTFEVNIFDFDDDIYGEVAEVEVLDKIRDIVKFDNEESLQRQINEDVSRAKKMLEIS